MVGHDAVSLFVADGLGDETAGIPDKTTNHDDLGVEIKIPFRLLHSFFSCAISHDAPLQHVPTSIATDSPHNHQTLETMRQRQIVCLQYYSSA